MEDRDGLASRFHTGWIIRNQIEPIA